MALSVFASVFGAYRVGKEDGRKEWTRSPLSLAYYLESRGLRLHVSSPEPGIYYLSESWRPPHELRVLLTPMDDLPGRAAAWNGTIRVRNVSEAFESDPSWPDNGYFRHHGLEVLGDPALVEKVCKVLNG